MPQIPFDTVVFDLDGTLADTALDLAASLNHTLTTLGREPIEPVSVRYLIGDGARALLRRGLAATGEASEALVEQGFPILLDHYAANICSGTSIYPGVEEALEELSAGGIALAVCTNKPERLTHKLLEALGWTGRFQSVVAGDTLPVRKPDPAPLHEAIARAGGGCAAFVGDSVIDADTSKAAHVPFVAVSFGFSDRPVQEFGASAVINHYRELPDALAHL